MPFHDYDNERFGESEPLPRPSVQDSEAELGDQYQTKKPKQWQVGDLIRNKYSNMNAIIVDVWLGTLDIVQADGFIGAIGWRSANIEWAFCHNTGLRYETEDIKQVQSDFDAGLFTPYFEIL